MNHTAAGAPDPEDRRVGPYRVLTRIGEGGMGVVHLAEAPDGRRVALKVLRPHVVGDREGRQRLAREVVSLRKVRSRHVAEILDADPWGELAFIVTRYVPGDSLTELVKREGPVRGADLDHLADHLLAAVREVHGSGVLHRDVKPTNVVMEGRSPILIDFGLARLAEDPAMTATGILLGTPGYLAPELVLGEQPTPAVDVHGWAATVVFAATGSSPYGRGHTMAILDRTRRGEVTLDGVPAGLQPLLESALTADPLARPTTEDVATELARLRGDDGPTTALSIAPAPPGNIAPDATAPWQSVSHASARPTTPLTAVSPPPTAVPAGAAPGTVPSAPAMIAPSPVGRPPAQSPAQPLAPVQRGWPPPPSPTSVQPVPVLAPVPGSPRLGRPRLGDPYGAPLTGAGRLRRGLTLVLLVLLVAAATRLAPYPTTVLVAVGAVAARATTRSRDALWRRRSMRGRSWSDGPRSVVGWPWHLAATAVGSLVLVASAALVASITVLVALLVGVPGPSALALGGAALACATWWGPGAVRVKRSVLPLLTTLVRPATSGTMTLVAVAGLAAALWLVHAGVGTVWAPGSGPPWEGLRDQVSGWARLVR